MATKILVVEDEAEFLNLLRFKLGAEGFQVLGAQDGVTGLKLVKEQDPDLVLLDVMMPRSDGFDICRRLKENNRTATIPVILLTARNSRQDREHGQQVRADGYITKPFSPRSLIEKVQSLLGVPKE